MLKVTMHFTTVPSNISAYFNGDGNDSATVFENPFHITYIRIIFTTSYATVFVFCIAGKYTLYLAGTQPLFTKQTRFNKTALFVCIRPAIIIRFLFLFCPATKKWRGIMLYPPKL